MSAVTAATIFSCAPALYKPVPEQATGVVSYDQLVEGRRLYVNSCSSCHALHLPHEYSNEVWIHNLDEMQERSKISDKEKELILTFLVNVPKATKQ